MIMIYKGLCQGLCTNVSWKCSGVVVSMLDFQ